MMFISFIYRINGDHAHTYHGKYIRDYISDDHDGLDKEVLGTLLWALNTDRKANGLSPLLKTQVMVGVVAFVNDEYVPVFSSSREIACFDFYSDVEHKVYIRGNLLRR